MTSSLVFAGVIAAAALLLALARSAWRPRYVRQPLMTPNETEFFRRLERAFSHGYVFPQVAMSALIRVQSQEGRRALGAFRRISQKRVDYAIFDPGLKLLCVVELDDRSHDKWRDRERDALLASAGIPTIRWDSRRKPTSSEIRSRLLLLSPQQSFAGERA